MTRRFIGNDWRPKGFDRWQYYSALLDEMPVVCFQGGVTGTGPQRFAPVGPLEDDFPVRQKGKKK